MYYEVVMLMKCAMMLVLGVILIALTVVVPWPGDLETVQFIVRLFGALFTIIGVLGTAVSLGVGNTMSSE